MKTPKTGHGNALRTVWVRGSVAAAVCVPLLGALPVTAYAQWEQTGTTWKWKESDGAYRRGSWLNSGGVWYWFDDSGVMVTGWREIGGVRYWFAPSGAMATGWRQIDGTWYWFESSGAMASGWRQIGGTWYWFDGSGAMVTGLHTVNGVNYLFLDNGAMATGRTKYQDSYYFHKDSGAPTVGWWQEGATWYHCDEWGKLSTGWEWLGAWYYFSADGSMARVSWVGDYYLSDSGAMATSVWIGDRYVGADGRWQRDKVDEGEPHITHTTDDELWGVDMSSHNHATNVYDRYLNHAEYAYLQTDFAIIKATQGGFGGYRNPFFERDVERAFADDKVVGIYHYVTDEAEPEEQAETLYLYFEPYVGRAFPVVDWEGELNEHNWKNTDPGQWLERFSNRFWDLCGVMPVVYTGANAVNGGNFDEVAGIMPLWVAGYKYVPGTEQEYDTFELPKFIWGPLAGWGDYDIWQFSSSNGKIDRDYTKLGRAGLAALGKVAEEGEGRWIWSDGKWWYREHTTGNYPSNGWFTIDGETYHFDAAGWMSTGWLFDDGDWYYLGADGERCTGWQMIDGDRYFFSEDGRMAHDTEVDGEVLDSDGVARGSSPLSGASLSTAAYEPGWSQEGGQWYYYDDDSSWAANAWRKLNGSWYRFGPSGALITGWFDDQSGWWYHANSQGQMDTGWISDGTYWYYLGDDGWMRTGWFADPSGWWYHANSVGRMDTGWITDGAYWYYLGDDGWMRTGWFADPSGWWYHANSKGQMDTGWITDGTYWYYLGPDGWMRTGWYWDGWNWYHFTSQGRMETGWLNIGGYWYYFYSTGEMARDTEVDGYALGPDGAMHSSRQDFIDEWTARIDNYLEGTAMEGCGYYYAVAAYDYDVDPRILPAVSGIESGWGKHCFTDYNAWGWFSTLGNSWAESIDIITRQFSRGYGHDFDWDEIVAYVGDPVSAVEWLEILNDQMALI